MHSTLLKCLLFSSLITFGGCRLAVVVVEGGEVQSVGSGTCLAGKNCVIEITGANFSETFTAVPHSEGAYVFEKWNTGGSFLCAGSIDPVCVVDNTLLAGNANAEQVIASDKTFYIMPVFTTTPTIKAEDIVVVNGVEWAQPDLFPALSPELVGNTCLGGICSGRLNDFDVDGWRWATGQEVYDMLNSYGHDLVYPEFGSVSDGSVSEAANEAFLADGWRPTWRPAPTFQTGGLVCCFFWDPNGQNGGTIGEPLALQYNHVQIFISDAISRDSELPSLGVWLYRPVAE